MSAFAPVARASLLVALCCSAAYAGMSPDQRPIVVAAVSLPDAKFLPGFNAGEITVPKAVAPQPQIGIPAQAKPPLNEPFAVQTSGALPADVSAKWRDLQSRIDADESTIAACRTNEKACTSAIRRFLSLVDVGRRNKGRARLGMINRAVNLSVRPVSDLEQYGYLDFWASPLQTLASGAGDCEDYAIVKYVLLRDIGFDPADLRLVIVRDNTRQTDHAVVAVRDGQDWLILDNRTMVILSSADVRHYQPLFSLDQQHARAFASAPSGSVTNQ